MIQLLTPYITLVAIAAVILLGRSSRTRLAVAVLVLLAFWLRLGLADRPYLHKWDESYHALVAKNMAETPFKPMLYRAPVLPYDYKYWPDNHIWVHKPPLTLWMMSASMQIFGESPLGMRMLTVILSSLTVGLVYLLCTCHFGRVSGLIAGFLCAVNGHLTALAAGRICADHVDTLMIFLVTAGIVAGSAYVRHPGWKRLWPVAVLTGLAVLTKSLPGYIVLGTWGIYALCHRVPLRRMAAHGAVATAVSLLFWVPWDCYIHYRFPDEARWESHYNFLHITQVLEGHDGAWTYHLERLDIFYGPLIHLGLAYALILLIWKRNWRSLPLWAWALVVYAFFAVAKTKMPCYVLVAAPAVLALYAESWRDAVVRISRNRIARVAGVVAVVLTLLAPFRAIVTGDQTFAQCAIRLPHYLGSALIVGKIHPIYDSVLLPAAESEREAGYVVERQAAADVARQLASEITSRDWDARRTVAFHVPEYIDAMFFTGATAYGVVPSKEKVQELLEEGYTVILYRYPSRLRRTHHSLLAAYPSQIAFLD